MQQNKEFPLTERHREFCEGEILLYLSQTPK